MPKTTREKGISGEDIASVYLENLGYNIRHKNWRSGHKEIDIIAEKSSTIVFIEVKSRRKSQINSIRELISNRQIHNLICTAEVYIDKYQLKFAIRFDLVVVAWHCGKYHITHIKEAFVPGAL